MSVQAYQSLLIQAVKSGVITPKSASRMFNRFLEKRLKA